MRNVVLAGLFLSLSGLPSRACAAEPAVSLGRPMALHAPTPTVELSSPASLARPQPIIRAQNADIGAPVPPGGAVPPPPPPPPSPSFGAAPIPGDERYNCGVVTQPLPTVGPVAAAASGSRFHLQSDPCFEEFISPVSNPFLFEDPRSLTEIRPIFMFQMIPNSQFIYQGGNIEFYGMQARVHVTDRLSFVLNKFGGLTVNPGDGSPFTSDTTFAEVWLGPKFTFLRNENTKTLGAVGLTFQIPTGGSKNFQDTGTLTMAPYLSFGQNFARSSFGSMNVLSTTGYALSVNDQRSDYLYSSLHLDYDIANCHRFYPLVELNYIQYTRSGSVTPINFEGGDLINFGATDVGGHKNLTIAGGMRYKFSEHAQLGVAAEFPLLGTKDLLEFRLTADFILRY